MITRRPGPLEVRVTGEGAGELAEDASNLVCRALASGLGLARRPASSSAATASRSAAAWARRRRPSCAGLVAANALGGLRWTPDELLARATELEGHADNAAACIAGGMVAVRPGPAPSARCRCPEDLAFVAVIPEARTSTERRAPGPARAGAARRRRRDPRQRRRPGARPGRGAAGRPPRRCWRTASTSRTAGRRGRRRSRDLRGPGGPGGCLGATISGSGPAMLLWCRARRRRRAWPRGRADAGAAAGVGRAGAPVAGRAPQASAPAGPAEPTCASPGRWGDRRASRWRHARGVLDCVAGPAGRDRQRQPRLLQRRRAPTPAPRRRWPTGARLAALGRRRGGGGRRVAAVRAAEPARGRDRARGAGDRAPRRRAGRAGGGRHLQAAGGARRRSPRARRSSTTPPACASPRWRRWRPRAGVGVVAAHFFGPPKVRPATFPDVDVPAVVAEWARERVAWAAERGIPPERLVIDPGIGLGKSPPQDLELLRRLDEVAAARPAGAACRSPTRRCWGRITGAAAPDRLRRDDRGARLVPDAWGDAVPGTRRGVPARRAGGRRGPGDGPSRALARRREVAARVLA